MAGLWDRVVGNVDDRVDVHLIIGGIRAVFVRQVEPPKGVGVTALISGLNSFLVVPLDTAAEDDIQAIADVIDARPTIEDKLTYVQGLEWVFIGAEVEGIGENKWRSDLEI